MAQNSKVQSTWNYLRYGQLDKAKTAIDEASQNAETAAKAKTWYYRGNVYLEISKSKEEKYMGLDPDPLKVAVESYKKAVELDTKKEFYDDILSMLSGIRNMFYNKAVDGYSKKQFKDAMKDFASAADIFTTLGQFDSLAIYNAAICAEYAEDYPVATKYFLELKENKYTPPQVYISLSNIYRIDNQKDKALSIIAEGRKAYPDDLNLIIAETNLYLAFNQTEKALENLQLALKKDTTNATIYFAIGTNYNTIADDTTKSKDMRHDAFERAEDAYIRSLRLTPNFFDANYNLGALYVNKVVVLMEAAGRLPLDATSEYDALKKEADAYIYKALPFLEKASELQPNDLNTLYSLKQLYTRTNQTDKVKMINEKISQLSR